MITINKKSDPKNKSSKKIKKLDIIALLLALFVFYFSVSNELSTKEVSSIKYSDFIEQLSDGQISEIILEKNDSELTAIKKDGTKIALEYPKTEEAMNTLYNSTATITTKDNVIDKLDGLSSILWLVLLGIFIFSAIHQLKKGGGVGQSLFDEGLDTSNKKSTVKFDDVAGNEESKASMDEIISYLKNPDKFAKYGIKPPKGVLLYGPPGTGKTLLAKAVAGEADANFLAVSGSDFVDKFVGNGASRVRRLFSEARKLQPCIIFIDEIDAVGGARNNSVGNDERHQTLNALLSEIDGFSKDDCIIVMGATNRVDSLDNALVRSGRFNTKIYVGLPDLKARKAIFEVHSKNKPISDTVDFDFLAKITTYFSGADIDNVMNKAGFYAANENKEFIDMNHINKAINNLIAGDEKKDRSGISNKDKTLTAYHEAGHAIVAKLKAKLSVPKITIIPTTHGAGGYTQLNLDESPYRSKSDLLNQIAVALGGRVAEEIIFGEDNITTGASGDIKNVFNTVKDIVCVYGMSDKFSMLYLAETSGFEKEILDESKLIIDSIYRDTLLFLNSRISLLHSLANKLLEEETVYEKDFDSLIEEFNLNTINKKEN